MKGIGKYEVVMWEVNKLLEEASLWSKLKPNKKLEFPSLLLIHANQLKHQIKKKKKREEENVRVRDAEPTRRKKS